MVYILATRWTSTETLRRLNAVVFKFSFRGVFVLSFTRASFAHCIVQCFAKLACRVVNAWQFMQDEEPEAGDVANAEVNGDLQILRLKILQMLRLKILQMLRLKIGPKMFLLK